MQATRSVLTQCIEHPCGVPEGVPQDKLTNEPPDLEGVRGLRVGSGTQEGEEAGETRKGMRTELP